MKLYDNGMRKEQQLLSVKDAMEKAGVFFFLLMILEIPLSVLILYVQNLMPVEYNTLISILITQGYMLVAAIGYMFLTKIKPVENLRISRYKIVTFFLSIVVLVTAMPMATWLNLFSQLFTSNKTSNAIFGVTQVIPAWLGILVLGCLPGFVEEVIYRGIIYTAFKKRSVLTGIVISALSFGLMHMNFNQMLYAVYLGVVFALMVEATGSLVSTMLLHMLFNAVNTAYIYVLPTLVRWTGQFSAEYADMDTEAMLQAGATGAELLPALFLLVPLAVGGLVLTWLLLKAIAHINGRSLTWKTICEQRQKQEKTKPVNVWLMLGWALCLISCIGNL